MMPSGPPYSGWSCGTSVRPATVSTTGTPCVSAKRERRGGGAGVAHAATEHEQRTLRAAQESSRGVGERRRGRGAAAGRGAPAARTSTAGKSNSSACASWGSASTTGPQSAGSVSTRATWGSVESSCSGRVIRSK